MDTKKIGLFLKELRKEKGLTQEQLAEILLVSGRTISRWETGSNMPDLSLLIQIADFYGVEIKDILNGERKSEIMDKELKETLSKVADYSKLEKEKAMKTGNTAFGFIFVVCAVMIVIQLITLGDLFIVAGETVTLLLGGLTYIGIILYYGVWETGSRFKSTPAQDALISVVLSGIFSVAYTFCLIRLGANTTQTVHAAILFFIGIAILSFAILRLLAYINSKRKNKIIHQTKNVNTVEPVSIFTADGTMQADMVIDALKRNGIAAYKQDVCDASFSSMRYGMGRGIDDRVLVFVANEKADDAIKVISELKLF